MSPAKTTARSTSRTRARRPTTQKTARTPPKRTLSASHKKALAEGRNMAATVDRYLTALNMRKRRGRKVSQATLEQRLGDARRRATSATGVEKVVAAQNARDLRARLVSMRTATGTDVKGLEAEFVKVAKRFSENRGVGYGAWRDAGVPAAVLKRAGIARTRG